MPEIMSKLCLEKIDNADSPYPINCKSYVFVMTLNASKCKKIIKF